MNWLKRKFRGIFSWCYKLTPPLEDVGDPVILPLLNWPNRYIFYCPGCEDNHTIDTGPYGHILTGTQNKPTIKPSVLSNAKNNPGSPRCHSWVTGGRIKFLDDCTHDLAGKTVNLPVL